MKTTLNSDSGGALLFAVVTALLISSVSAALITLTNNQAKITQQEVNRIKTIHLLKAGYVDAYSRIAAGDITRSDLQNVPYIYELPNVVNKTSLEVRIDNDPNGISAYRISVKIKQTP